MSKKTKSIKKRIAVGIAAPLIVISGALFLYFVRLGPPCVISKLTGIYCPGCGAGRASVALLHGNFLAALDYNLFFTLFLPFVIYYLLKLYIKFVFAYDVLPFFKLKKWHAIAIFAFIVVFTFLRNIPVYPFDILAP